MSLAQTLRFSKVANRLGRTARSSPEEIDFARQRRLGRLLQCAVTAPFFREKYQGLDLNRIELSALPTTNKKELMSNFDRTLTDPEVRLEEVERFMADPTNIGRWFLGRYCVSHTSGSRGQPLILVQNRTCLQVMFAAAATRADARGIPSVPQGLLRFLRPTKLAVISMIGFSASGHAFTFLPEVVGGFVHMTRLSPTQPDLVERLNALQPNAIVAYPSILDWLASQSDRLRLGRSLRQLSSFGEELTERARQRVSRAFGVPLYNHYGVGECLFLAEGCPTDGGAHINEDLSVLEVVDENYLPVPAGQAGAKILVTNLVNAVQPIIRYEIDDIVTLADQPCTCGSLMSRIERIEGRSEDVLWVGEQMLTYILFKTAIEYLHEVREWQAVQVAANRVEIGLELLPGTTLDQQVAESVVTRKLNELGLPSGVLAAIEIVPSLSPDPITGKLKRMISRTTRSEP